MTIAILSYKSHNTLIQTLHSYQYWNLPHYDNDRVIFFQEISDEDKKIAKKYGYIAIGSKENMGIAEGYKRLVEFSTGEFFLFLENDWRLLENPAASLTDARFLISTGQADIVRLRHRKTPGWPLWTKQFEGNEMQRPTHLLDCVHWQDTPASLFPDYINLTTSYNRVWYTATSKNANWTNNPHLARTAFIRENVIPHLGNNDLEKNIQPWWEQQDFKVAQGDGLFTHDRID